MILKKNERILWGIPYQGSKTKLVERIAKWFPNADHFYDLFGGGFSVSHYMLKMRSHSFKHFHYNELRPGMCELIRDAIDGKYNYDKFKPEWISRERFMIEKDQNPYIKIIWSFGNNGRGYLFGKEIENQKRSMHQAIVFDEFDSFMHNEIGLERWPNHLTVDGKRLLIRRIVKKRKYLRLQQLEQLERLQQLQQLEQLEQLQMTNLSYEKVNIEKNSVIYCDIPYKGTADYGNTFSHTKFFDWADSQENPVFISEYKIDDNRLFLLKEFSHRTTFSNGLNSKVIERLYGNKAAFERVKEFVR